MLLLRPRCSCHEISLQSRLAVGPLHRHHQSWSILAPAMLVRPTHYLYRHKHSSVSPSFTLIKSMPKSKAQRLSIILLPHRRCEPAFRQAGYIQTGTHPGGGPAPFQSSRQRFSNSFTATFVVPFLSTHRLASFEESRARVCIGTVDLRCVL